MLHITPFFHFRLLLAPLRAPYLSQKLRLHISHRYISCTPTLQLATMVPKQIRTWRPEPGAAFKCGLEIHTQLNTQHKLFSLAKNRPNSPPNSNASFFDFGLPGTFPKLNPEALLLALTAATALKSNISPVSSFDRKHYFYYDQPLGYQITQHFQPLAKGGFLQLTKKYDGVEEDKTIGIEQVQIEQDTAKLNYNDYDSTVSIDHNRAGVPLIELVTKPDFDHLSQVRAFVKKYVSLMTHLGVCTGDMENGAMRCDVNVSVNGGNRVEIKNLGSTSEIMAAAKFEYNRQVAQLRANLGPIVQETRSWNGKETVRARSKEDAVDYRYFPDIELPRVHLHESITEDIRRTLPEFPDQILQTLTGPEYGLELKHARFLVDNPELLAYYRNLYDIVVGEHEKQAKIVNNWLIHELIGAFNKLELPVNVKLFGPEKLASLILMVLDNKITITSAKLLLTQVIQASEEERSLSIQELVEHYDLTAPSLLDEGELNEAIEEICKEVMESNPDVVQKVRNGKKKSINFLIGRAMKETQGRVDSKQFEKVFLKLI